MNGDLVKIEGRVTSVSFKSLIVKKDLSKNLHLEIVISNGSGDYTLSSEVEDNNSSNLEFITGMMNDLERKLKDSRSVSVYAYKNVDGNYVTASNYIIDDKLYMYGNI